MKTIRKHGQMSESLPLAAVLTLSGGFQDAYTYIGRGKVFANAQTGNIVLLGVRLSEGDFGGAARYVMPLAAFAVGIFAAQVIRHHFKNSTKLHWRQLIVLIEIAILFAVGLVPAEWNFLANAMVSFSCALQVDAFRKVRGNAFATTMCIGNLRSGTDLLSAYHYSGDRQLLKKGLQYYLIILIFAVGAVLGNAATARFGNRAVWWCCAALAVGFVMMLIREEIEEREDN